MSDKIKDAHLNLRVSEDVLDKVELIASALDRSKSWVVTNALQFYLNEGDGADVIRELQGLEELRRGEGIPVSEGIQRLKNIVKQDRMRA